MIFATDLGKPRVRAFIELATASEDFIGAESFPKDLGHPPRLFRIEGRCAWLLGIPKPAHHGGFMVRYPEDMEMRAALKDELEVKLGGGTWTIETLNIPPGRYFPRMARPSHQHPGDFPTPFPKSTPAHAVAEASTQISILVDRLRACFQVITPTKGNFDAFGAELRNILLLAATEFEAQCRAILKANLYGASSTCRRWNTNDYFKLEAALRLKDYAIGFPEYPWLSPIAPFRGWEPDNATKSLSWYHAYNAVKHDREESAHLATLERALEAVTAVVIIGLAQFGISFLRHAERWRDLFEVHEYPRWSIGDTHGALHETDDVPIGEPIAYPF